MASFPGASEAAAAAGEMHQGASRLDGVRLRIGINTGEPGVDGDGRWFGLPLVVAARLCAVAAPGEVLVPLVVKLLLPEGAPLEEAGLLALKGLARPVEAYRVRWQALGPTAHLALPVTADLHLVGRERALAELQQAWQQACDGMSAAADVVGEPGAGKSRLVAEFLRLRPDAVALIGRCDDRVGSPFQPFAEILRASLAGSSSDAQNPPAQVLARIAPGKGDRQREATTALQFDRAELFGDVVACLSSLCAARPTIVVVDDLHWADEPTALLLRHLARSRPPGLLFIATYRHTDLAGTALSTVLPDLRRLPHSSTIELEGLDAGHVAALAREAGVEGDIEDVVRRAGGNPLFISELLLHSRDGNVPTTIATLLENESTSCRPRPSRSWAQLPSQAPRSPRCSSRRSSKPARTTCSTPSTAQAGVGCSSNRRMENTDSRTP